MICLNLLVLYPLKNGLDGCCRRPRMSDRQAGMLARAVGVVCHAANIEMRYTRDQSYHRYEIRIGPRSLPHSLRDRMRGLRCHLGRQCHQFRVSSSLRGLPKQTDINAALTNYKLPEHAPVIHSSPSCMQLLASCQCRLGWAASFLCHQSIFFSYRLGQQKCPSV